MSLGGDTVIVLAGIPCWKPAIISKADKAATKSIIIIDDLLSMSVFYNVKLWRWSEMQKECMFSMMGV